VYTYVIKGKISINNKCPLSEIKEGETVIKKDTVGKNVKVKMDVFRKASRIGEQSKVFRLNDSLKGSYSFVFESKEELDSTWTFTIPHVIIDCPAVYCSELDSVENCYAQPTPRYEAITPIRQDTTEVDILWECYCK